MTTVTNFWQFLIQFPCPMEICFCPPYFFVAIDAHVQESNLTASSHIGHRITSYRQLRVKDLPEGPYMAEVESNQRPSAPKVSNTATQPTTPLCLPFSFGC